VANKADKGEKIFKPVAKTADKTKSEKTVDGFANFAARLGVNPSQNQGRQTNLLSQGLYEFNLVTRNRVQLEAAYRGSWIVGVVIDTIAEDMTRAGITLNTNEGAEQVQEVQTQLSRLQTWQSTCNAIRWGRLYGGAIAVLQIKGQKLDTPLDPATVGKGQYQGLVVYDRWQLNPSLESLIDSGPEMGLPKYYDIVLGSNLNDPGLDPATGQHTTSASGQVRVHHSRCIRMIGLELPFWQAITEMMWGESILERMWDRLIAFDDATLSTASLINRAQLRTVGIEGLREILSAGGQAQESLIAQFEYMRQLQSNEGITLLDAADTFVSTAYSFAGLSDVLLQFGQQLSGACGIPLVRLFGQSPAGMSATGESDIRLYYDNINALQESRLRNPFEMILKIIWQSVTGEPSPSDLSFEFTPLWQMSALDKATIAKTNTDTIIEAHQDGLVDSSTAMKELKQSSGDTGLFTNITDEQIDDAENEEPPLPNETGAESPGENTGDPGAGPTDPAEKLKATAGDSAWKKIKRWVGNGSQA
jgi:phage-related protein (TIGR01555 family)